MNFVLDRIRWCGLAAAIVAASASEAQTVVPLEAYARLPEISSVAISPDGERLAMIGSLGDRDQMYAIVKPLGDEPPFALEAFSEDIGDQLLFSVDWVSNRHLLLVYRERRLWEGAEEADVGRQVIYNLETNEYSEFERAGSTIVDMLPDNPDHVLVSTPVVEIRTSVNSIAASRGRGEAVNTPVNLYRYNLDNERYRLVSEGSVNTVNWVLGENGEPWLRQDRVAEERSWRVYRAEGNGWTPIYQERYEREHFGRDGWRAISEIGGLVARDARGRGVWFSQLQARDKIRGFLFDPETGEIEGPEIAPEGFDLGGFRVDWRTGAVVGAGWIAERRHAEWFDPTFAGLQEQLQGLFPESDIVISDWDRAGRRFVVQVIGGETSTDYYLLDRRAGELAFLQTAYPDVPAERIHPVEIVRYQARDGLDLWGYLTHPVDRELDALPLVLLPHGGPQSRDVYGFDMWAQPLADMGYAVFQPQFRGSSGQGQDFVRLGHGEWGRKMQTDLTDAVNHLVGEGLVDPNRVCVFGWSYGGYAALAGYALTPEVYRCVVAGAPVSDIPAMMNYERGRLDGASVDYWTEYIGNWRVDTDEMIAISPARQASAADDPLLLIHGREDLIVPFDQSEIMLEAAEAEGNPADLVVIEGDGHNLLFARTRRITLEALTGFLQEHNPPDPR